MATSSSVSPSNDYKGLSIEQTPSQECDESDDFFLNSSDDNFEVSHIVGENEKSRLFSNVGDDELPILDLRAPLLNERDRLADERAAISGNSEPDEISWYDLALSALRGKSRRKSSYDVSISAIFLRDYENSRPCSLPSNIGSIKPLQLRIHHIRYCYIWQSVIYIATGCLFLSSSFDGFESGGKGRHEQFMLTIFSVAVFTLDVIMRTIHDDRDHGVGAGATTNHARKTRAQKWKLPTMTVLFAVLIETYMKKIEKGGKAVVWTAILKPIVFFYASSKARDEGLTFFSALTALNYVGKIVFKVIVIELFLLLSFACMASHLYFDFDSFRNLPSSFLSLFELQTTAATPSLWIPVYNADRSSAIFFISFLIICVFYMHSIVLSVVFQTYIHSMKMLRERASADRQQALRSAFTALLPRGNVEAGLSEGYEDQVVEATKIREVVETLRPHYNEYKVDALMKIIDANNHGVIPFRDYQAGIQKILHTSLRSARQESRQSLLLSSLTVFVAITNLVYVLLLSSPLEFLLLSELIFPVGSVIVFLGLAEVIMRLRPCSCLSSLSTARHSILDGLAIFAGIISLTGLIMHVMNNSKGLQWLLLGRAVDMIRIMRLSSIFCSIIQRSGEVLPAIVGPLALVLSSLHIFAYAGMGLWGGAVSVGIHDDVIVPLYDLNNFNEYTAGLLTMFNIFVVNDWQEIARVYLTSDKLSSPYIVYPFFVSANLLGVNIMLNVLTAFFVGAFVTKVEDKRLGRRSDLRLSMSARLYASPINHAEGSIPGYHVQERHGYDSVISTITGNEGDMVKRYQAIKEQMEVEKMEAILEAQNEMRSVADSEIASIQIAYMKLQQDHSESSDEKTILARQFEELEKKVDVMKANESDNNIEVSRLLNDLAFAQTEMAKIQEEMLKTKEVYNEKIQGYINRERAMKMKLAKAG